MMNMKVATSAFSKVTRLEAPGLKSACLIMLHGLSGSAAGWTDEVRNFQMILPHMAAILPTATAKPVTMLNGQTTNSWHDIHSLDELDAKKCHGLAKSHQSITGLILDELKAGTPSDRIIVAGFSQGAAMALYASYQLSVKLAGVVALSGYLPDYDEFHSLMDDQSRLTPALICHGTKDSTVKIEAGRKAAEVLQNNKVPVDFKTYEGMGHESCLQEILDITSFITERLP